MAVLTVVLFYSQVGINTTNPQGVFNVDGKKDNPTTGVPNVLQQSNDLVVTSDGNVGIGTTTPTRKLEIVSTTSPALRLIDGSQKSNYVMMSDANGNGKWYPLTETVIAQFTAEGYNGTVSSSKKYIGVSIKLPPGKWLVMTNIVLNADTAPTGGNGAWVRLQWCADQDVSYANDPPNITASLNSGIFVSAYGIANGSTVINNTTDDFKLYYLNIDRTDKIGTYNTTGINWNKLGSSTWKENSVIAYPAN